MTNERSLSANLIPPLDPSYRQISPADIIMGGKKDLVSSISVVQRGHEPRLTQVLKLATDLLTTCRTREQDGRISAFDDVHLLIDPNRKVHFYYELRFPCMYNGELAYANQWYRPKLDTTALSALILETLQYRLADFLSLNNNNKQGFSWLQCMRENMKFIRFLHFDMRAKAAASPVSVLRVHFPNLVFPNILALKVFTTQFTNFLRVVDFRFLLEGLAPLCASTVSSVEEDMKLFDPDLYTPGARLQLLSDHVRMQTETNFGLFSGVCESVTRLWHFLPHNALIYDGIKGHMANPTKISLRKGYGLRRLYRMHAMEILNMDALPAFFVDEAQKATAHGCFRRFLQIEDQLELLTQGYDDQDVHIPITNNLPQSLLVEHSLLLRTSPQKLKAEARNVRAFVENLLSRTKGHFLDAVTFNETLFEEQVQAISRFYSFVPILIVDNLRNLRKEKRDTPLLQMMVNKKSIQAVHNKQLVTFRIVPAPEMASRVEWLPYVDNLVLMLTSDWVKLMVGSGLWAVNESMPLFSPIHVDVDAKSREELRVTIPVTPVTVQKPMVASVVEHSPATQDKNRHDDAGRLIREGGAPPPSYNVSLSSVPLQPPPPNYIPPPPPPPPTVINPPLSTIPPPLLLSQWKEQQRQITTYAAKLANEATVSSYFNYHRSYRRG